MGALVQSRAETVEEYLAELPESRRTAIERVRDTILENLPEGYDEGVLWGMIAYYVPLGRYPDTYNGRPLDDGGAREPEELHGALPDGRQCGA